MLFNTYTHSGIGGSDVILFLAERTMVVSEYHPQSVNSKQLSLDEVVRVASQTLQALSYINEHGIVHRSLCPENILLTDHGDIQLFNYGLYYMTGGGMDVSFPIGQVSWYQICVTYL
jgi:TBC domain-containing protein kinase-like protein